jgi:hypothetical protein
VYQRKRLAASPPSGSDTSSKTEKGGDNTTNAAASSDDQQTAAFYSDKPSESKSLPHEAGLPGGLLKTMDEDRTHTIIDFLKRPVKIWDGDWATTDVNGTELLVANVPEDVLGSYDMFADKLSGFYGFRAKFVLRVQINAQRFQQGMLLIHYFPQGQINPKRIQCANQSLTLRTQQPRVTLDCTESEAILEMPYVSPSTHYNLLTDKGPIGCFHVVVYSELVAISGATTVPVTIWGHFEDIDIAYPTLPFTPPALKSESIKLYKKKVSSRPRRLEPGRPQVAKPRRKGPSRGNEGSGSSQAPGEAESTAGPVSSVLKSVANVATAAKDIPIISAVAGPVSWVANLASKVASAFGYSNPLITSTVTRVNRSLFPYAINCAAEDTALPMGVFADNQVELLPGFAGTDVDEMSFAYIAGVPAFLKRFAWADTDQADDELFSKLLYMKDFQVARTVATASSTITVYDPIPCNYIANFYRYWRTSFVFTIKFVKTEFHTGRVVFYYCPGSFDTPDATNRHYLYREILDLSISNEFKVVVPWVSITPYKEYATEALGSVGIQVINPLVMPDGISPTIDCIVEVAAGNDFEVENPGAEKFPILTLPAPEGLAELEPGRPQMLKQNASSSSGATQETSVDVIASSSAYSGGLSPAKYCIGEKIVSCLQMMKRSALLFATYSEGSSQFTLRTGGMYVSYIEAGINVTKSGFWYDWVSVFGSLFAYRRGGMRIRIVPGVTNVTISANTYHHPTATTNLTYTGVPWNAPDLSNRVWFPTNNTGGAEIEAPQYAQTHMFLNVSDCAQLPEATEDQYFRDSNVLICNQNATITGSSINVSRQVSEDAQFGFFVGALPLTAAANVCQSTSYG